MPIAERLLTDSLAAQVHRLYPPGPGRSIFLVPEADTKRGRPDLLVVHASSAGVNAHIARGLRVPSPAAAYAITSTAEDESGASVSTTHTRRLRQEMRHRGWTRDTAARAANLVHFSIAIEAKIRDWRRGFRQVSHWGLVAHRSALLMPARQLQLVPLEVLRTYDVELLSQAPQGHIEIARPGRHVNPAEATRLWILELLVRESSTSSGSSR